MANILLTVNNDSRAVSKTRNFAGVQLENLEDAFIVKFADEFINGDGSLEYEVDGNPYFLPMTKNIANELYSIDITQALITEEGTYPFQVRITQGDKIFKSQIFYLKIYPSINAVDAPPPMPNWQQWVIEYVDEHSGKIDSISVNGTVQPIDENKNVDIDVPTETSQLTNDGDGTSPYATEDYVSEYGGKIDKIQKNGTDLPINNKTVNIPVPTTVAELTDASDYATVSEVNTALENVGNAIQTVNSKLQSGASSEDPCTTESFVNSSINAIAAFYITKNAAGDPFATKAELDSTSVFYSGGQVRVPTRNDYCLVVADITKAKVVENYSTFTLTAQYVGYHIIYNNIDTLVTDENKDTVGITPGTTPCYYSIPTTRYTYQNNQWEYQYIINDTSLTAKQIAAINSGITAALVAQIGTNQSNLASHIANTSNPHNVTKTQVGLGNVDNTSDINKPVSAAQQSALDGKIDKPVVAGTNGQILTSNGQGGQTWEDPVEAPIQSISLDGTNLPPDNNGNVDIPAEEPDTLEVAEADAVPIVTSISNASTDNEIPTAKAVNDSVKTKASLTIVADEYDNTSTYALNDIVIYQGSLYECTTAVDTAEDWDSTKWTQRTIEYLIANTTPDLSNYVDLSSAQSITGAKTFTSDITLNSTKKIGTNASYLKIGNINNPTQIYSNNVIEVGSPLRPMVDSSYDLGSSSYRWYNLHLKHNLTDGTNSISVANIVNKQDATDNSLNTTDKTVVGAINEVDSVVKGCNKAEAYADYSALITALNAASATDYNVGQSFYIQTLNVPDLWIMSVESTSVTYTYVDDATFVTATGASGGVQVGYYKLAQLETLKQDLTNYATQSDLSTGLAGCVKTTGNQTINGEKNFRSAIRVGLTTGITMNNNEGSVVPIIISDNTSRDLILAAPLSTSKIELGNTTKPKTNNTYDLGESSYQWKDAYIAGNLSDGTNSIAIADIASTTYVDTAIQNAITTALNTPV